MAPDTAVQHLILTHSHTSRIDREQDVVVEARQIMPNVHMGRGFDAYQGG
ncbi:MAG: hypothetical protein WBR18_02310 [Anaerolineales bacterium]